MRLLALAVASAMLAGCGTVEHPTRFARWLDAGELECNAACSPAQQASQEKLIVDPIEYNAIFGKEWVAGVSVEGVTATQHYKARK